jgi:hypothetical protein
MLALGPSLFFISVILSVKEPHGFFIPSLIGSPIKGAPIHNSIVDSDLQTGQGELVGTSLSSIL